MSASVPSRFILPDEVLGLIFDCLCYRDVLSCREACRRWCAELLRRYHWSTCLTLTDHVLAETEVSERLAKLGDEALTTSIYTTPIHIRAMLLTSTSRSSAVTDDRTLRRSILDMLRNLTPHVSTLSLLLHQYYSSGDDLYPLSLPKLERLALRLTHSGSGGSFHSDCSGLMDFLDAPKLTHLVLEDFMFPDPDAPGALAPTHKVEHLKVAYNCVEPQLDILLRHFRDLQHLELSFSTRFSAQLMNGQDLPVLNTRVLPGLRSLVLVMEAHWKELLLNLQAMDISSLIVRCSKPDPEDILATLPSPHTSNQLLSMQMCRRVVVPSQAGSTAFEGTLTFVSTDPTRSVVREYTGINERHLIDREMFNTLRESIAHRIAVLHVSFDVFRDMCDCVDFEFPNLEVLCLEFSVDQSVDATDVWEEEGDHGSVSCERLKVLVLAGERETQETFISRSWLMAFVAVGLANRMDEPKIVAKVGVRIEDECDKHLEGGYAVRVREPGLDSTRAASRTFYADAAFEVARPDLEWLDKLEDIRAMCCI
ncbi:hypothetical protein EXIGLDRAFT_700230 [Exidia glandulosa HHB12029]|uniref:F-box domain-containing protein n=1 Tax=Exidia glandulosa HHB12029 TaxID=1314781 RepID=A0A165DIU0_EXIGL|nr:hypothetical protein EXIGLDRAFT_700230 [Exidia glandulosa HHB12029]